jgi:hypothetical protein
MSVLFSTTRIERWVAQFGVRVQSLSGCTPRISGRKPASIYSGATSRCASSVCMYSGYRG